VVKKALMVLGVIAAIVAACTAYVVLSAGPDLFAARAALSASAESLSPGAIRRARDHLAAAHRDLRGPPSRLLSLVPVLGQNLSALEAASEASLPVLRFADELQDPLRAIREGDLLRDGVVRLETIRELGTALRREASALEDMEGALREGRTGWLLPPVWDAFDLYLHRTEELAETTRDAADVADLAGPMLGAREERTYLVMLVNNAELRGSGGILSGLGTLTANGGELNLGEFYYYADLDDGPPYRRVPAPADFKRRYGRYDADTTHIVNTTLSPDFPDVALVASRAFEATVGISTDGAILADARSIAALLPKKTGLPVPGAPGTTLTAASLPAYLYSKAYEQLGGASSGRRDAIVDVGKAAFEHIVEGGIRGGSSAAAVGRAVAGGHLRVASFRSLEQSVLARITAGGDLQAPPGDSVLVAGQNFGGDKLDYWTRRSVEHGCIVESEGPARCTTRVVTRNRVPEGLPSFVYQSKPYGQTKTLLEVYIPSEAGLSSVERDGEIVRFVEAEEEGRTSIGVYLRIPRGGSSAVTVSYTMPHDGSEFTMTATPQAMTHDADLDMGLRAPTGWDASGGQAPAGDLQRYRGPFAGTVQLASRPSERTGLPAVWESLVRFWREPLF
jgi:Protein of unknown function (DUF4012)